MTELQTGQSELHTAAPLSGPERTHSLQKAGQAKEEVREYIQPDLHFTFQQLKQRVVKGSIQSCYLDLLGGGCFCSYSVPQSLPSANVSLSFTPHMRDRHFQEITGPQENIETSRRESGYFSSKQKIPLTIMEFNHHSRHHEICKERIPKNPRAINSAITQLYSEF